MEDSDHQSGAFIGSNDDLLTEILIRLPVTSILRFKSVSKHWRSLLSHRHFTLRYDNIKLSQSLGLFVNNDFYVPFDVENPSPPPFRSLDFYFNRSNVRIEHSCNGLLLCSADRIGAREYYVFNPTTKQLATIPSVPEYVWSLALAFHQTHCVHYKVVCVSPLKPHGNMFQIQVYSSYTRTWKICVESFSANKISKYRDPVYCNGAVYWAPEYCTGSNFVCFKLDAEQLQMLPLPVEKMSYGTSILYFGESRGHLHLIFNTTDEYVFNVYEMPTDHSGWFVKYRVQLDEFLDEFLTTLRTRFCIKFLNVVRVVDVVRGKEEEDTFLVLSTTGKIIRYNVHDKSYKELYDGWVLDLSCYHRYIDTLSSL